MKRKILCMMFFCFIIITTDCMEKERSSMNEQDNVVHYDSKYNETALNELNYRYEVAESERNKFRNDIENIFKLFERERIIPFYKNCDSGYFQEHARVIENCFNDEYVNALLSSEKTSEEIKPIIVLLMIEGTSPPDFAKQNEIYYKLTFYQSIASRYEIEEKNAVSSPNDGINTLIIGLINEEGNWQVVYFGNDS